MLKKFCTLAAVAVFSFIAPRTIGAEGETNAYLEFIRSQAESLRRGDRAPASVAEWASRKSALRQQLTKAWGNFPARTTPPEVRKAGEVQRDGYRVEKLLIQTLPGVWMTANAYVPNAAGKVPALLMVHGHWRGAKQDPVVQSRCIGAVKLGFFVLVVDAFGAGERGVGRALGEYHGDMTAATLLPVGLPLSGLQVFENMRAVDYLQTRREVDADRIGISGASGGGNQSMYAGAWDERLDAVVPVCSVGNYQAYLGAACCMCEVVPGALTFTEEGGVLGLVAPRALMVINATRDSRQFSDAEAKVSLKQAQSVFDALGKPQNLRHTLFESGHDYSQPMREAVYGWMTLHLKGQGSGEPIPEPAVTPENPDTLRCFPGESRPEDWITIPKFAAAEARKLLKARESRRNKNWELEKAHLRKVLAEDLFGGFPKAESLELEIAKQNDSRQITFSPEQGITLIALQRFAARKDRVLILIDLAGGAAAAESAQTKEALEAGWSVVTLDLRATGKLAWSRDKVGRAPDHTSAQWALWIGRPLLGQWVWDIRRFIDAIHQTDDVLPARLVVAGNGPGGIIALAAAALDDRITGVATIDSLASYVTDTPYEEQRMGIIVPGILKHFGDISDFAALLAPRHLLVNGSVSGTAASLNRSAQEETFHFTSAVYSLYSKRDNFQMVPSTEPGVLSRFLNQ